MRSFIKTLIKSWLYYLKEDRLFPGKKWVRVYDDKLSSKGFFVDIIGRRYFLRSE